MGAEMCVYIYIYMYIYIISYSYNHQIIKKIFEGARVGAGGWGSHVAHSNHNSTYVLLIFSFLFKTFPNALTISWNILILTFIDYLKFNSTKLLKNL